MLLAYSSLPRVWRALTWAHWTAMGAAMMLVDTGTEESRDRVRERHPAWADQADAAADEALRLVTATTIPGRDPGWFEPDDQAEAALRGQALRIVAGLAGGCLQACPHADVSRPRPLFAAAWGDRVDCLPCFRSAPPPDTPMSAAESHRCDLCGRVSSGPVLLATPTIGMLTIGMGVCRRCLRRLMASGGVAR